MAKIIEFKEIPLESITIGTSQVRVRDVGKGIDELAGSIRIVGQLEPILVCKAEKEGKFEIITGQRRYLAHRQIGAKTIKAGILDEKVDELTAKVLSLTENVMRRDLNRRDLIDVCTYLYKTYGSSKDVSKETGIPYDKVREYVKYDRLSPKVKELVDKGEIELKSALRATDAASVSGELNEEEAVKLAKEMENMSGIQQKKIVDDRYQEPEKTVDEIIENAKTGGKFTQITVTVSETINSSLNKYATDEETSKDDAARTLIEEGLIDKGYLQQ